MRRAGGELCLILPWLACAHPTLGATPKPFATAPAPGAMAAATASPNIPLLRAPTPATQTTQALGPLQDINPEDFCVTCGALSPQADRRSLVESPKMRAVVDHMTGRVVDLHFTYLGPTRRLMALSSGLSRSQIGLKLFAHDACNLVYVMWRLLPEPGIVVSTKRNLGMRSSSGCGNGGYSNLRPQKQGPTPPVAVGVPHRLRVMRDGDALSVYADEALAWQGRITATQPDDLEGVTGVRTDNGRYIFKLQLSDTAPGNWRGTEPVCTPTRHPQEE